MRHRKHRRKLGRTSSHRKAMLENLVISLLTHQRIRTTVARAKEARKLADRVISLAKQGTLPDRRKAFGILQDRSLVKELFDEVAPRFKERAGGYTRLIRCGPRPGDGAQMAILELVELKGPVARKERKATKEAKPPKEEKGPPKPPAKKEPEVIQAEPPEPKAEAPAPVAPPKPPKVPPKGLKFLEGLRKKFRKRT